MARYITALDSTILSILQAHSSPHHTYRFTVALDIRLLGTPPIVPEYPVFALVKKSLGKDPVGDFVDCQRPTNSVWKLF